MKTQSIPSKSFIFKEKNTPIEDLGIAVTKYLYHWPLFLISLLLTIGAAIFYLQLSKPVYEVKATILIKDEKKSPDQSPALGEIDMVKSSKITENEIKVLKSKAILTQVVEDLGLWITYRKKDRFSYEDLYGSSPVKLVLNKPVRDFSKSSFFITINDRKSFQLKEEDGESRNILFNTPFRTSFGTMKLEPAKNLLQYAGETIEINLVDPEQLAIKYQDAIDVSQANKLATALELTLTDINSQRGKDVLNRLIRNYGVAGTAERIQETKNTLDFIDQRLTSLTGELTDAEKGIEEFKSSRGLTDISSQSQIRLENLQANDTRLSDVNLQLSVIQGVEQYINSPKNLGKAPATMGITDPGLSSLILKLADLQLQRERLLAIMPETNPDFEPLNRQIASSKEAIRENVQNIKSSLLNTRKELKTFDSSLESSIRSVPAQEREYISIKRQQAIKESLYTYLLQKREEVSVSYASTLNTDRVVDQAYSGQPKMPQKPVALAMALFLGLMIPTSVLYVRNRKKITDLNEIYDATDVPVIGDLPFHSNDNPIVIGKEITAASEQFRALRSKLYYKYGEHKTGRVTLVTSTLPNEGKSFVASNLSMVMARAGRKTVILELDLRKPKIAELFNFKRSESGISSFLTGTASLEDITYQSDSEPNLHFISCGPEVENPSELLEGSRFNELIELLRESYDDIIIDSPPVRLVPDAMIISRATDLCLYVIRQGATEKNELSFIQELSDQKQLSEMYLIFNGIRRIKYGYGYNYNSDYYSTEKTKSNTSIFSSFSERF